VAGKTAPDCTPTVWRPSTFWCYEIRDQATIIASALFTAITTIYGGIAFYGRFTLGRQRLNALGVDLKHLKKVVEVFATAFLIDKVIRLHKRKDEITVKTLWRDIPFDQDMDRDVVAELQTQVAELKTQLTQVDNLIDARLDRHFSGLKAQGKPLSLDNLALFVRAHVQAGDAIVQQQPGGSSANDNCIHVSTKHCRTIVPAFAPGRRGVQPTTQKVLALQPIMPPAPPRSNPGQAWAPFIALTSSRPASRRLRSVAFDLHPHEYVYI
jgi:hypothetical protein